MRHSKPLISNRAISYMKLLISSLLFSALGVYAGLAATPINQPVVQNQSMLLSLDASTLAAGTVVVVSGFSKVGDGGGGNFMWLPDDSDPADGVVVVTPNGGHEGRWVRQWWSGTLTPEMAGAVGDGKTNDLPAFNRLVAASLLRGAFAIRLSPGRQYFMPATLDLSTGAPGLIISGPSSPLYDVPSGKLSVSPSRLEFDTQHGATLKLGSAQVARDLMIWRHGLADAPTNLSEVRAEVARWYAEDGANMPLSVGIFAPFDDAVIEGCRIVGFHTGIEATGGRFKILRDQIDTAGYGVEVTGSKATSIIEDVAAGALWSRPVAGNDALGSAGYRPGIGYYIHGGADGLQMNSIGAELYVTGIWIDGTGKFPDWLISIFQPDIETPPNDDKWTAGIKTTGEVRRLSIVDPRILIGGNNKGPAANLDFGHDAASPNLAENDNVTVIGGALEVLTQQGMAVLMRKGSTGTVIGTTFNLANGDDTGPLVIALPGAGRWTFVQPELRGHKPTQWLEAGSTEYKKIKVVQ
jgi:hypothetical protein